MSRKKSKKKAMITNTDNKDTKELAPVPSKMEQMANMLFNRFLKQTMKIYNYFDNDYISIVPYVEDKSEEKDDGTDVVCYEITPKSNKQVAIYLDDNSIYASLKGTGVKLDDDALAYLVTNIISYVRGHCPVAA